MLNQQRDDWLNPTRELLAQWGEHLRSIQGVGLGYPSRACHLSEHGGLAPLPEDDVADRIDRVLCKVRSMNREVYTVLSLAYHNGWSDSQVAGNLNKTREKCRQIRINGEVMVTTFLHDDQLL